MPLVFVVKELNLDAEAKLQGVVSHSLINKLFFNYYLFTILTFCNVFTALNTRYWDDIARRSISAYLTHNLSYNTLSSLPSLSIKSSFFSTSYFRHLFYYILRSLPHHVYHGTAFFFFIFPRHLSCHHHLPPSPSAAGQVGHRPPDLSYSSRSYSLSLPFSLLFIRFLHQLSSLHHLHRFLSNVLRTVFPSFSSPSLLYLLACSFCSLYHPQRYKQFLYLCGGDSSEV